MNLLAKLALAIIVLMAGDRIESNTTLAQSSKSTAAARDRLVRFLSQQGVKHPGVLKSIAATPRHLFVPASKRKLAWYDMALPIGHGQTISPPFVVANMTQQIDPQLQDRVLEIGTGSGYQAAVLSPLVAEVYSIEIVEPLGKRAARTLSRLGYRNVSTKIGDGFLGWSEHAPFDKIIVTCSPDQIPQPLVDQLREGGRMVIPIGQRFQQTLYLYTKTDGALVENALEPTFFVPMTGQAEDLRSIKDDTGVPQLRNGSFERIAFETLPDGWYYVRGAKVESAESAPHGGRWLVFSNDVPGRWAQALQAIGVDGKRIKEIEVTLAVRGRDVQPEPQSKTSFHAVISFFDDNRAPAGERKLGPWNGTYDWTIRQSLLKVPGNARLAVIAIGLCGSTGEIAFDNVQITVVMSDAAPSLKRVPNGLDR